MANEHFPHLFIHKPSATRQDYKSVTGGGGGEEADLRLDRVGHAQKLQTALNKAWVDALHAQAVVHSSRRSIYLEFVSEPGLDLLLKSLETKKGIKLLNVHVPDKTLHITKATVQIPKQLRNHFLKRLKEYEINDNPPDKDGNIKPKNHALVASIAEIRAATVESFWQDGVSLIPRDRPEWVEIWISTEDPFIRDPVFNIKDKCKSVGIMVRESILSFPDRAVLLGLADIKQLGDLLDLTDIVAEFRAAREVATYFILEENRDQAQWVRDLISRVQVSAESNTAILILDHGVNNGHPLLSFVLTDQNCHTVKEEWGTHDHDGHGTLMAGMATYGDLCEILPGNTSVILRHHLESSKILPPDRQQNPKHLWGDYTAQGVSRAEIAAPYTKRIVCMAITCPDEPGQGRPSSWSATIDALASGANDDMYRLFIVSGGNVDDKLSWNQFPQSNMSLEVHEPGQAWNALTVGASTNKTQISHASYRDYRPLAEVGDLSPFSTTSMSWDPSKWPIKPEVLFEGGNVAVDTEAVANNIEDLQLLSTGHNLQSALLEPFNATSAASAQAALLAAKIQVAYPDAWPETVRGLIIHSAEWTSTQERKYLKRSVKNKKSKKSDYRDLLKICGYGVPNLDRAMACASNSLSLIAQSYLQPFDQNKKKYVTKDMHIHRLPWPIEVLEELGETPVKMRVTLSYFIEPSPGERGRNGRYSYASHALRFELNSPGETETELVARTNKNAREPDRKYEGPSGPSKYWLIGETRDVGSVHSDIWTGTAAELALSNLFVVYPVIGWWRERPNEAKYNKQCRYSLIVSFSLPQQDIDIYTPIAASLGIPTPVEIAI